MGELKNLEKQIESLKIKKYNLENEIRFSRADDETLETKRKLLDTTKSDITRLIEKLAKTKIVNEL